MGMSVEQRKRVHAQNKAGAAALAQLLDALTLNNGDCPRCSETLLTGLYKSAYVPGDEHVSFSMNGVNYTLIVTSEAK